jgi:hypothetical protein
MTKNKKVGYVTIYDLQGLPVRFLESVDIPYYLGKGFTKTPPKQPKTPATAAGVDPGTRTAPMPTVPPLLMPRVMLLKTHTPEPPPDALPDTEEEQEPPADGDKPRGRGRPPKAK